MRGFPGRLLIAALGISALTASVIAYVDELRARRPVDAAISKSGLDARRPTGVRTLRYQPAADLRASFFADMTLDDVYRPVSLAKLSAEERGRWLRSLTTLDAQLAEAREVTLDALERRPGWAYHQALVGELEYAILRRASLQAAAERSRRWEVPLMNGMASAPGNLEFPMRLAGAYIETWGVVEPTGDPVEVFRLAMATPAFVNRNYRLVGLILGEAEAIELLPDDPRVLRIAFAHDSKASNVEAARELRSRIDDAERDGRERDLDAIRERKRLGDVWGQRAAASQWVARYKVEDLDDASGRREAAEVLSIWPATRRGSWLRDPRANLIRYFLSGRERDIDGATLAEAVTFLSDVPATVRARVLALAGQAWEAEQLFRDSGAMGSFEWTPVLVDLARAYGRAGKRGKAAEILNHVAPTARTECNVLLLRRDLGEEEGEARALLDELTRDGATGNRTGALSLCIDPVRHEDARLMVSLDSASPALVSYGWDGGRVGSVVVDGRSVVSVPLSGMVGRHPFRVETEAGANAEIVEARVEGGK